jgi:hypothetical protein
MKTKFEIEWEQTDAEIRCTLIHDGQRYESAIQREGLTVRRLYELELLVLSKMRLLCPSPFPQAKTVAEWGGMVAAGIEAEFRPA